MNTNLKTTLIAFIAVASVGTSSAIAGDSKGSNCSSVYKSVHAKVSNSPDQVLKIVSDAIAANEACACEAVQAGIKASKASSKVVGEIVGAAIGASSSMANTIVECATAVAPDAIGEIEAAYARAMKGGKGSSYSLSSVSVGGVYLISPTAPSSSSTRVETVTRVITVTEPGGGTTDGDASP